MALTPTVPMMSPIWLAYLTMLGSSVSLSLIVNRQTLVVNDITSYNHIELNLFYSLNYTLWQVVVFCDNVHSEPFITDAQVASVYSASSIADSFNALLLVFFEEGLARRSVSSIKSILY